MGVLKLWYLQPATRWNQALPVGNGRISAMVYGSPNREVLQLNESTLWAGGPSRNDNPDAKEALPEVRRLVFAGQYDEAQDLVNQKVIAKELHGARYQPVGNLVVTIAGHDEFTDYRRELDLETAIHTVSYRIGDLEFTREVFCSQPDQVLVLRFSCSQPGRLSCSMTMDGDLARSVTTRGQDTLVMAGCSGDYGSIPGQVRYSALAKVLPEGGRLESGPRSLVVTGADRITVLVSMATNFVNYQDLSAQEEVRALGFLAQGLSSPPGLIDQRHREAYQKYFRRVHLDLGTSQAASAPTDQRLAHFSQSFDPSLITLYYQFGRYLLISCSQPGGQPANLQGIWNDSVNPPWGSKYTLNINLEMNYWPAHSSALSELAEPLVQMVKDLSVAGRQTAQTLYGARGWVVHHNTDLWRMTGPIDGSFWGMWPLGGAWLCLSLWENYAYQGDRGYLQQIYPLLKGACEFFLDVLVEEPHHGWLVVVPSISPENAPQVHPNASISAGTTMDVQLLYDLFTKTVQATKILGIDQGFADSLNATLGRLPPLQIGRFGQLQEWMEDWDDPSDRHRHVSHLYGAFPSSQISAFRTPELLAAARTSLQHRGDASTGWSMGWKVNLWARFLDGNHAFKLLQDQLTLVDPAVTTVNESGGTYPNLFDAHPPFQIDGNFGCASGITEMLLQSHDGAIHLLPALPDLWSSGSVSGLRARGGFELAFDWKDRELTHLSITGRLGGVCRLRLPHRMVLEDGTPLNAASGPHPNPFYEHSSVPRFRTSAQVPELPTFRPTVLVDIATEPGKTYKLRSGV